IMSEQWLKDIADRMSKFETDEPQGLWQAIDTRRRKAAVVLWWRRVAVAAAVAAALGVGIFFAVRETATAPQQPIVADVAKPKGAPQPAVADVAKPEAGPQHVPASAPVTHPTLVPVLAQASVSTPQDSISEPLVAEVDTVSNVRHSLPPVEVIGTGGSQPASTPATMPQYASSDRDVQLALFTSGGIGGSGSLFGRSGGLVADAGPFEGGLWTDAPNTDLLVYDQGEQTINDVDHHLPVRVGFAISFPLSERLSIGTGLTYTYLATDIFSGSVHSYLDSSQSVHYIGVPLSLSYRVFSVGRFDAYAIGGAMVEKAVRGRVHETYILNGTEYRSDSYDTELPWQFSLNLSAGFQYNISPTLGIFVEPGLQYYLPNNSSLCTIYSDKPLNFSLKLGLRLSLQR
ncbi:MAG: outer membrane beta-barrel protein, partial [Muribaculaceae bacterium]